MYFRNVILAAFAVTLAKSEVHLVNVGKDGLRFTPETINPKKGDTVIFHLYPRHNVVSTSFGSPCVATENSFFSGPFDQTDNGMKKFVVNVTTENPVWYYCAVPKHCQGGMVGAWNAPTSGRTIEAFAAAAKIVNKSTAPSYIQGGQLLDDEHLASLTSDSSSQTESTTSTAGARASAETAATTAGSSATTSSTPGAAIVVGPGALSNIVAFMVAALAWVH